MENISKLTDSDIKLIDTKLETKINRFLEQIIPDKVKAYKDSLMLDPISYKATSIKTDHNNVVYRTNDIL